MIIQCEDGLSRELRMKVTVWQIFKSAFFCFLADSTDVYSSFKA